MARQKIQFWVGKFKSRSVFDDFFEEPYSEDEDIPISKFVESQNEIWIDHDFLEIGFENKGNTIKERFTGYSYSEKWVNELEERMRIGNTRDANAIAMLLLDGENTQINSPVSVKTEDFQLEYLGQIEFQYDDE